MSYFLDAGSQRDAPHGHPCATGQGGRVAARAETTRASRDIRWWTPVLVALTLTAGAIPFLVREHLVLGRLGLPLDDAWIHARYAHNLARGRGYAFNPGEPVPGDTSPLWVLMLAALRAAGVPIVPAAKGLGLALLWGAAIVLYPVMRAHTGSRGWALLGSCILTAIARLVWASLSGMEISLYVFLTVGGIAAHDAWRHRGGPRSYLSTLAFALAGQARPECWSLFVLAEIGRIWHRRREAPARRWMTSVREHALHAAVFLAVGAPSFAFNMATIAKPFPNTFYAKVDVRDAFFGSLAEGRLAEALSAGLAGGVEHLVSAIRYTFQDSTLLSIGAAAGFAMLAARAWRTARAVVPILVFCLFPVLRGMVSPTAEALHGYYGRYVMNLVPLAVLFSAVGWRRLTRGLPALGHVLLALALVVELVPRLDRASHDYVTYTTELETLHVAAARWISHNTPRGTRVASRDIGALGFFSDRHIVDCWGLVTPEILPYLRSAERGEKRPSMFDLGVRVVAYLAVAKPEYVVTFNSWPLQTVMKRSPQALRRIYRRRLETLDAVGQEPVSVELDVYRVSWDRVAAETQRRP